MHRKLLGRMPADLARAAQQFTVWRQSREFGARIPERLWQAAVSLAARHGISRTAGALKLGYYDLKKRLDRSSRDPQVPDSSVHHPAFLELPAVSLPASAECVIEFEKASGDRMRVHLKGVSMPDLAAFGRDFWETP